MSGEKAGAGRRQVLAALTDHGPASRVELGRRTGLSSSAVSTLAHDLIADGLVTEEEPDVVRRGRGRPARRLVLRPPPGLVVGADVGNTHVRVAAAEVGGPVLAEQVATLAGADSPERTLRAVEALVLGVVATAGRTRDDVRLVTLGLPAPLAHDTGRVADNNILPGWVGHHPGDELAALLGVEVVVENDANLGALGEQTRIDDGDGPPGARGLLYLKLSTGIGAGLVLDGRLFRGVGGTAGEVGHVQVDPAGALCRCGSRGCLETVVSVPRLVASLAPVTDDDLGPADLARLVAEGHTGAVRVVTDAGRTVGQALASLVTVLNPATLVVGGPWQPVNVLMADRIAAAVGQWAQPSAARQVSVRAAALGDRAEVVGALDLAGAIVTDRERGHLLEA